jgi:hypothetical protein
MESKDPPRILGLMYLLERDARLFQAVWPSKKQDASPSSRFSRFNSHTWIVKDLPALRDFQRER